MKLIWVSLICFQIELHVNNHQNIVASFPSEPSEIEIIPLGNNNDFHPDWNTYIQMLIYGLAGFKWNPLHFHYICVTIKSISELHNIIKFNNHVHVLNSHFFSGVLNVPDKRWSTYLIDDFLLNILSFQPSQYEMVALVLWQHVLMI